MAFWLSRRWPKMVLGAGFRGRAPTVSFCLQDRSGTAAPTLGHSTPAPLRSAPSAGGPTGAQQRHGLVPRRIAIVIEDRLRGVLSDVDAAQAISRVRAAAMEHRARKADDAAGVDDRGHAGVVPEVPNHVVGRRVSAVWHYLPRTGAVVRQDEDGAVRFVDVVQGDPARHVLGVLVRDVAAVLMPGEARLAVGALDDELVVEQAGVLADCGAADLAHCLAEQQLPQRVAARRAVVDEVALAPPVETYDVGSGRVHLRVALVHAPLALAPQHLKRPTIERILDDEPALVTVRPNVIVGDHRGLLSNAASAGAILVATPRPQSALNGGPRDDRRARPPDGRRSYLLRSGEPVDRNLRL